MDEFMEEYITQIKNEHMVYPAEILETALLNIYLSGYKDGLKWILGNAHFEE